MAEKKEFFTFILFDNNFFASHKYAKHQSFISALQDFETIFYEISESRWLAAITSLHSACEKLLKINSKENSKMEVLINNLIADDEIKNKSHEFRKFRNKILHEGYKPKDDPEAIRLFFCNGMPLFEEVFKKIIGKNIAETFEKKIPKSEYPLWKIFKKTKTLIQKENFSSKDLVLITSVLVLQCRQMVFMGGTTLKTKLGRKDNFFTLLSLKKYNLPGIKYMDESDKYEDLLIENGTFMINELSEKIYENVLKGICETLECKEIFKVDGPNVCPMCTGHSGMSEQEVWINFEVDGYSLLEKNEPFKLGEVKSAFCSGCLQGTSSPLLVKHFYSPIKEKNLEQAIERWKEDYSDTIDFYQIK